MIRRKYIILIWIIILIIFTFYCIYNLYKKTSNNFENIIDYINQEQLQDKITDIQGCNNIYDDNIAVRSLGYNNCTSAYSDYYNKNLNINNKYGNNKSLAEICPVSTKSNAYLNCMKLLLNKFNTNANIMEKINTDMTNIINDRLTDRTNILNNIEQSITPPINIPYIHNPETYYELKYGISKSMFKNVNTVNPSIITDFFVIFTPIKGQFNVFNNLTITLKNITPNDTMLTILDNNTNTEINFQTENIDYYLHHKNIIKLDLINKNIKTQQPNQNETLQQLLQILGINIPSRILLSIDEFTSTENIIHTTYKLMTSQFDTILIMEKQS